MPELPEVETIRRCLEPRLQGQRITGLQINNPAVLLPEAATFQAILPGLQIQALQRCGKYLIFQLADDWRLVIHLRMTGKLLWTPDSLSPVPLHTHLILNLEEGAQLRFNDVRRFGRCWLVPLQELREISGLASLGPEPVDPTFDGATLEAQLSHRGKVKLKCALLDQKVVAGLGNIYVDEALFAASLHPLRLVNSLTFQEIEALAKAARQVLTLGIQHRGTSFRDYLDGLAQPGRHQNYLQVFQREGQLCLRCGTPILREKIAGRSSFYCPCCQRLP